MQPNFAPIAKLADIRCIEEVPLSGQYAPRARAKHAGEPPDQFTVKTVLIDHD